MLVFHKESKTVASLVAAEAVPALPVGGDHKRRRFLRVKRAIGFKIPPGFLKRHVFGDERDDIKFLADLLCLVHSQSGSL